jgi:asparagine synthase (glutamine-hydrolysing)
LLAESVPPALFERPKMGFGIPLGSWLRGNLREWAESLLAESSVREAGLAPDVLRARWREHLSGRRDWQASLWNALVYLAWRKKWLSPK